MPESTTRPTPAQPRYFQQAKEARQSCDAQPGWLPQRTSNLKVKNGLLPVNAKTVESMIPTKVQYRTLSACIVEEACTHVWRLGLCATREQDKKEKRRKKMCGESMNRASENERLAACRKENAKEKCELLKPLRNRRRGGTQDGKPHQQFITHNRHQSRGSKGSRRRLVSFFNLSRIPSCHLLNRKAALGTSYPVSYPAIRTPHSA